MHPIHYSIYFNALVLITSGALAAWFNQPVVFALGLLIVQHFVGRFPPDEPPSGGAGAVSFGFVPPDEDDE
jgi:hypothetical protein